MRPYCLLPLLLIACSSTGPRHLNPPERTDTTPFAHGVLASDTYYVAGTLGLDPATGQPPKEAEQEARLVMDGIKAKLGQPSRDPGVHRTAPEAERGSIRVLRGGVAATDAAAR